MYEVAEGSLLNRIDENLPINISYYPVCSDDAHIIGSLNIPLRQPADNDTSAGIPTLVVAEHNKETSLCWKQFLISRPFVPSVKFQIMWVVLFTAMLVVAIVGNMLVIWIIMGRYNLYS